MIVYGVVFTYELDGQIYTMNLLKGFYTKAEAEKELDEYLLQDKSLTKDDAHIVEFII